VKANVPVADTLTALGGGEAPNGVAGMVPAAGVVGVAPAAAAVGLVPATGRKLLRA